MGQAWSKSGDIQLHAGEPASGALAYFFQGGTTTPLTVYQDAAESTPHEHPVEADGNGQWPLIFIPFTTSYDVKVTTSGGTQLYYHVEIPNPDPVEAAGDTVDDSELIQTGDIIFSPKTGTRTGFVRCNGRTIGSASSGATERANADTSDLYSFLYDNFSDSICAVSGGRGSNAASDFAANKALTLLDGRSGVLRGVSDMGNTSDGLLASATFTNGSATTGGSWCGANTHTLTEAQLPSHTHTFSATTASDGAHTHTGTTDSGGTHSHTISITDPGHTHNGDKGSVADGSSDLGGFAGTGTVAFNNVGTGLRSATTGITASSNSTGAHTHTFTTGSSGAHTHTVSGTTGNGSGSGSAHNNVSKSILGTFYQKL